MKSQAELEAELEAIEKKLSSGVSSITVDGTKTEFNLNILRERAREIRSELNSFKARRPRVSSIHLGGF